MQAGNGVTLFLTSVLILTATNAILSNNSFVSSPLLTGNAYAQSSPDLSGSSDLGATGGGLGAPGDNSTGLGGSSDLGSPGDNSTGLGLGGSSDLGSPGDNSTGLGLGPGGNLTSTQTAQNSTASATTPEFGSMVSVILILSIASIIIISTRTRLRF